LNLATPCTTARIARFICTALRTAASLLAALLLAGPAAAATTYLFTTFKGDAAAEQKLWVHTSADGTSFSLVAPATFAGPTGVLRDPSIMKHTDGRYYIAFTVQSWTTQSTTFAIASSSNLLNWTTVATVDAGVAGTAYTWAPEWYVEDGVVRIIVSLGTAGFSFRPYLYTATSSNLSTWSGPQDMGIGSNYIDTFVVKSGSQYHAFAKNETTKYIEHAVAPAVTGPWTWTGTGNWSGWGSGYEAPALARMDDGTWRIYIDRYTAGGIWTATSTDLNTWSGLGFVGYLRHGTVLRDTQYTGPVPPPVVRITNRNSGKVLDVQNPNTSDGANVGQYAWNGGPWQQWQFFDTGTGHYSVMSVNSGKCLDVAGVSGADNANIIQWTCSGATNQHWQWAPNGSHYLLRARHSGKCADVSGASTADGADVRQWACSGGTHQDWTRQ
jgi:hypothetical protein